MADRYEINHEGEIVVGDSALCADQSKMLHDLFSQYGWNCVETQKEGACHVLELSHASCETKTINVYSGTIRNESRNAYEKKIQLGTASDPKIKSKNNTIILGIYVYQENDSYKDAIFVGYPIDENVHYETNPSIRGTFVNKLLIQAKTSGFVYDQEHNSAGFRAEFIYYYLANYYKIHYENNPIPKMENSEEEERTKSETIKYPNRIIFGAPGTGKSFLLNKEREELLGKENETDYERVTFHPDYTYANFVGTYKPVPCKDSKGEDAITYEYVPGPFMRIYVNALKSSWSNFPKPYLLIIEEINRANVAAVFGDIFQLLDRDSKGESEYPIQASEDMRKYLMKELECDAADVLKIKLPSNLYIWATMNSADQGVFPMDTAFKRRWNFKYIGIDDNDADLEGKKVVLGTKSKQRIEWNKLRKAINNFLAKQKINEDKQLGPYFIARSIVVPQGGDEIDSVKFSEIFKSKVIMYLFEDAAKQKRASLFEGCFQSSNRYSEICREFDAKGIGIFNADIQSETQPEDITEDRIENATAE